MNQKDIGSIARIALAQIDPVAENSNPHERILLTTLLKTGDYHQDALPLLFQSPAFLTTFKEKYAQNRYFLIEDYFATTVLIGDNESNPITIKNSPTEASAVTETQVKECELMTTALPIKTPIIPLTLLNHGDSSQCIDSKKHKIMANIDSQNNEHTNEQQKETMKVIDATLAPENFSDTSAATLPPKSTHSGNLNLFQPAMNITSESMAKAGAENTESGNTAFDAIASESLRKR